MKKRTLIILHQFNPSGSRVGGIGKYILSFIKNAPNECDIKLIGVSKSKDDLFKWKKISISGRFVDFYPICAVRDENVKSYIPLTIRYVLALVKAKMKISFDGALFMQRPEYIIPFLGTKQGKFLIIHTDLERQLDRSSSEVIWARLPRIYKFMLKQLLEKFSHVFSVNSDSVDFIKKLSPQGYDRVSFSPTWAEGEYFFRPSDHLIKLHRTEISVKYNISKSQKWLLFIGRFQQTKNIEMLIDSIYMMKDVCLLMAGDGNQRSEIMKIVKLKGLEYRVVFLGNVPHKEINRYIYCSDAYVSCSFYEGMSIALLEALQSGTPVVTTPTGESARIVKNGVNGIVTKNWEIKVYVDSIRKVLSFKKGVELDCIASVKEYAAHSIILTMLKKMAVVR